MIALCCAPRAHAQVASSRGQVAGPAGQGPLDPDAPQRLDVNFGVAEGYDSDVLADLGTIGQNQPLGTYYTEFQASGEYQWQGERVQAGASAASTMRYYHELSEFGNVSESAGAGFSAQLAPRTRLFVNGTAAYSPSYLYGLFPTLTQPVPGQAVPDAPGYSVNTQDSFAYGGSGSLTHGLNARSDLVLSTEVSFTNFLHETEFIRDYDNYGVGAAYLRRISRYSALKLSYLYRRGQFGYSLGTETAENGLQVGMELARPLSATRKMTFAFNVGATDVNIPEGGPNPQISGRFVRATSDASFTYDFRRSWQARAAYRRGVEYLAVLRDPVFTNGASAAIDGLLSRGVLFTAGAAYSSGASALNFGSSSAYTTYTGNVRLSHALTRTLSLYGEYLYYYYDFRGTLQLQPGFPRTLERNAVRVGLTLWVPMTGR